MRPRFGSGPWMRGALGSLGVVGSLWLGGCSTSLTLINDAEIEGCIRCADGEHIDVVPDERAGDCEGSGPGAVRIPRAYVREIDHPGKAQAGIGVALMALGTIASSAGLVVTSACGAGGGGGSCNLFLVMIGLPSAGLIGGGIPLAVTGFRSWGGSRRAAEPWGPPCPLIPHPAPGRAVKRR